MLMLKRYEGQRVFIHVGDVEIILSVQEIDRHAVKLGFIAPPDVPIHREELLRQPPVAAQ